MLVLESVTDGVPVYVRLAEGRVSVVDGVGTVTDEVEIIEVEVEGLGSVVVSVVEGALVVAGTLPEDAVLITVSGKDVEAAAEVPGRLVWIVTADEVSCPATSAAAAASTSSAYVDFMIGVKASGLNLIFMTVRL